MPISYAEAQEEGFFTDAVGRDWQFIGTVDENPGFMASFHRQASPPVEAGVTTGVVGESSIASWSSPDDDGWQRGERADYLVSVIQGEALPQWLLFEMSSGWDIEEELDAEYIRDFGWIDDLPETDDVLSTAEERARIVGSDNRTALASSTYLPGGPVAAVRKMRTGLWNPTTTGTCTGTMITSDKGITNAHCLDFSNSPTQVIGFGSNPADGTGLTVPHSSFFVNGAWFNGRYARNDWLVFKTNVPINLGSSVPFVLDTTADENVGYTVAHIGTPGPSFSAPQPVWWQSGSCHITSKTNKVIRHNCDTVSGHSGGPIYKVHSSTYRKLIAVHRGQYVTVNQGPKVAYWRPNIVSAMNGLTFGAGTPWEVIR